MAMMAGEPISTGCGALDALLSGGFRRGRVHLLYGEAATGKTTIAIAAALNHLRRDPGAVAYYVDSDHKLTSERLSQIAGTPVRGVRRLLLWRPVSFRQQARVIEDLHYRAGSGDMVVVDSVTGLYRVETGGPERTFRANKELNRQLALLVEMTRTGGTATVLTGQVRSVMDETDDVEPVAPRLLRFWSDVIIRLDSLPAPGFRQAAVEKPVGGDATVIRITERGVEEV